MTEYLNPANIRMRSQDLRPHPNAMSSVHDVFFSRQNKLKLINIGNAEVDKRELVDTSFSEYDLLKFMRTVYDTYAAKSIPSLFEFSVDPLTTDLASFRRGAAPGETRPSLETLNRACTNLIEQHVARLEYRQNFHAEAEEAENDGMRATAFNKRVPYPLHIPSAIVEKNVVFRGRNSSPYTSYETE